MQLRAPIVKLRALTNILTELSMRISRLHRRLHHHPRKPHARVTLLIESLTTSRLRHRQHHLRNSRLPLLFHARQLQCQLQIIHTSGPTLDTSRPAMEHFDINMHMTMLCQHTIQIFANGLDPIMNQTLQSLLLHNLLIGCVHWPAKPVIQDTGRSMQVLYRPVMQNPCRLMPHRK
jgi:hypothetical protein